MCLFQRRLKWLPTAVAEMDTRGGKSVGMKSRAAVNPWLGQSSAALRRQRSKFEPRRVRHFVINMRTEAAADSTLAVAPVSLVEKTGTLQAQPDGIRYGKRSIRAPRQIGGALPSITATTAIRRGRPAYFQRKGYHHAAQQQLGSSRRTADGSVWLSLRPKKLL